MTPKNCKLYAAMHEDIAEGFVWLKRDELPARCIVKITNTNNGNSVFCEALQFEANFLRHYNQDGDGRCRIEEANLESSMVMNHWYRAQLGKPGTPLLTQTEYPLTIKAVDRWYNRCYGHSRACLGHPQVVVRVAFRLARWSVALAVLSVLLGVGPEAKDVIRRTVGWVGSRGTTTTRRDPKISLLSVEEVLAWRNTYGDLLGKPREAVIKRFGTPQKDEGAALSWGETPRTGNRSLLVLLNSDDKSGIVQGVKVAARSNERLDPEEIIKRAPMFTFDTGTFGDALLNYFIAVTKDGRNGFQFDVTEREAKFRFGVFLKK